jgi:hypothetical protein
MITDTTRQVNNKFNSIKKKINGRNEAEHTQNMLRNQRTTEVRMEGNDV